LIACILASGTPVTGAIQPSPGAAQIKVTLLGTGSPAPASDRFSACILVEAGDRRLLFDAGRGCVVRLQQAKVPWTDVTTIFLTHLHSDHVLAIPDILLTGWTSGRTAPLEVRGPQGTSAMMTHLVQAYEFDIRTRVANARQAPQVDAIDVVPGVVYERDGVKVTAFEVDHGDVRPAFGYRVDAGARSVVLSGDTRFSENLIRHAQGVDLLVHEVALGGPNPTAQQQFALALHTSPERAAEVFRRVSPRLAVYSHILLVGNVTAESLMATTRQTYSGPLEIGSDLTVIEIGQDIRVDHMAP
jgi:ribonuclease Z